MPNVPLYVPILKGKEGEFAALEALDESVRMSIAPLIEIPPVPLDYVNDKPSKTIAEHVVGIPERLKRCSFLNDVYLDFSWVENGERVLEASTALEGVLSACRSAEMPVIPVVSLSSPPQHLEYLGENLSEHEPLCMRLVDSDFEEENGDIETEIERLLGTIHRVDEKSIDLIIDLEDLGPDSGRTILIARSIFQMLQRKNWRRIVLAAASFPEDLSNVSAATVETLPRLEWDLWKALQRRPKLLPRPDLIFADYAISHSVVKGIDPRIMRMSASIRYTAADYWLILKGRNVRQYGFEQYFDLCRELIERQEYCGQGFSWADDFIWNCAHNSVGPGNATTWRKVGVNHHMTLVARQLSNSLPVPSNGF